MFRMLLSALLVLLLLLPCSGAAPFESSYEPAPTLIDDTRVFSVKAQLEQRDQAVSVSMKGLSCTFSFSTLASLPTDTGEPDTHTPVDLRDVLREFEMLDREQMTSSNRQQWEVDFRRSSRGIHQNIGRDQYVVARDVQVLPDPDNPNLQMFYWTHGDDCGHKYLTRNVTMRPVCEKAARNKYTLMTQVREPEMCVYEMLVGTSLVCRDPRYPSSAAGTSGTALWTLQMRSTADGVMCSVHNTNQLAKKIIFGSFALTIASTDGSITNMQVIEANVRGPDRSHIGEQETSLVGATLQSAAGFKGKLEFAYEEVSLSRAQA